MMRQPQWAQVGARAWMAHSKLSNTWASPPIFTSKHLSYALPQTSQVATVWPSESLSIFIRTSFPFFYDFLLRAAWAFLMFCFRARVWAEVGLERSGIFRRSFASKRSPVR